MLITKLVEEMKYNQGISFWSEVESIIRRRIRPKIRIHSGKIKLPSKRSKWKAFIKILVESRMKFSFCTCQIMN